MDFESARKAHMTANHRDSESKNSDFPSFADVLLAFENVFFKGTKSFLSLTFTY